VRKWNVLFVNVCQWKCPVHTMADFLTLVIWGKCMFIPRDYFEN
jgi:hypothetical protein